MYVLACPAPADMQCLLLLHAKHVKLIEQQSVQRQQQQQQQMQQQQGKEHQQLQLAIKTASAFIFYYSLYFVA